MTKKKDIEDIKARNKRVETDKAWETSWTRRLVIALFTYAVVGAHMHYLGVENAWIHAVVPAGAYILSTLSLPIVKNLWADKIYNKKEAKK